MVTAILGFAFVAGLMTLVPGIDTALVLRTTSRSGRQAGFVVGAGICSGCLVWGISAALGVSALLTASESAFTVLRVIGAAYLVFLGARMIPSAFRADGPSDDTGGADPVNERVGLRRLYLQGLMTNVLNPKVGAFYVALLPQFIPPDQPPALAGAVLAFVHGIEGMLWFALLILLVHQMSDWLKRRRVRQGIDAATGIAVIGFGLKLALARD